METAIRFLIIIMPGALALGYLWADWRRERRFRARTDAHAVRIRRLHRHLDQLED